MAGLDRARRYRRRRGLPPHAAGLASRAATDRRARGARHRLRLARADRRDLDRRCARGGSDPHAHPHPRRPRGRRQSRAGMRFACPLHLHPRHQPRSPVGHARSRMAACAWGTTMSCELFAPMREGDLVLVAEPSATAIPNPRGEGRFHYAGLGGSGHERARPVPGDDGRPRERQRPRLRPRRARRTPPAARKHSASRSSRRTAAASAAIARRLSSRPPWKSRCPDYAAARAAGIPVLHRSELLAHFVASRRTDRGERHQRQIHRDRHDLRDPARAPGAIPPSSPAATFACCKPRACPAMLAPALPTSS